MGHLHIEPGWWSWMWGYYNFYLNGGYCLGPVSDTLMRKSANRPGEQTQFPSTGTIVLSGPISQGEFIAHTFSEIGSYPDKEGVWDLRSGAGGWGLSGRSASLYTGRQECLADALRPSPYGRQFVNGISSGFWRIAQLRFEGNYRSVCKVRMRVRSAKPNMVR